MICQNPDHKSQEIKYFCLEKTCPLNRLMCSQCAIESHIEKVDIYRYSHQCIQLQELFDNYPEKLENFYLKDNLIIDQQKFFQQKKDLQFKMLLKSSFTEIEEKYDSMIEQIKNQKENCFQQEYASIKQHIFDALQNHWKLEQNMKKIVDLQQNQLSSVDLSNQDFQQNIQQIFCQNKDNYFLDNDYTSHLALKFQNKFDSLETALKQKIEQQSQKQLEIQQNFIYKTLLQQQKPPLSEEHIENPFQTNNNVKNKLENIKQEQQSKEKEQKLDNSCYINNFSPILPKIAECNLKNQMESLKKIDLMVQKFKKEQNIITRFDKLNQSEIKEENKEKENQQQHNQFQLNNFESNTTQDHKIEFEQQQQENNGESTELLLLNLNNEEKQEQNTKNTNNSTANLNQIEDKTSKDIEEEFSTQQIQLLSDIESEDESVIELENQNGSKRNQKIACTKPTTPKKKLNKKQEYYQNYKKKQIKKQQSLYSQRKICLTGKYFLNYKEYTKYCETRDEIILKYDNNSTDNLITFSNINLIPIEESFTQKCHHCNQQASDLDIWGKQGPVLKFKDQLCYHYQCLLKNDDQLAQNIIPGLSEKLSKRECCICKKGYAGYKCKVENCNQFIHNSCLNGSIQLSMKKLDFSFQNFSYEHVYCCNHDLERQQLDQVLAKFQETPSLQENFIIEKGQIIEKPNPIMIMEQTINEANLSFSEISSSAQPMISEFSKNFQKITQSSQLLEELRSYKKESQLQKYEEKYNNNNQICGLLYKPIHKYKQTEQPLGFSIYHE